MLLAVVACWPLERASAIQAHQRYNIPSQSADAALREFARQSGRQILFPYDAVAGRTAPGLFGEMTGAAALERLTHALGLVVSSDDGRTIALVAAPPAPTRPRLAGLLARLAPPVRPGPALPPPLPVVAQAWLDEIVVTATRMPEALGRVPLSITALTQSMLDEQGVKTAQDLASLAPPLRITANTTNGANVSIRGIVSTTGAATTGVYLDDTPLQKRAGLGVVNGFGVVFPQVFDLERVEILRGPQGTLYGSSSQGGTVRFITPAPSLVVRSGYMRAEASITDGGDPSYELGGAVGGPIVPDKLGFRASLWGRRSGGYIDHISRFTGATLASNTNEARDYALRLAATWQAVEGLKVTPAVYYAYRGQKDADTYWLDVPAYSQPERYFTVSGEPTTANSPSKAFTYPANSNPAYGMYGPYKTGANACVYSDALASRANDQCPVMQPRTNTLAVGSVTLDYDLPGLNAKSITSLLEDHNDGSQYMALSSLGTANAGDPFVFNLPFVQSNFYYRTRRNALTQEIRLSSTDKAPPLQWVAGLFFSESRSRSEAHLAENADDFYQVLRGAPQERVLGAPLIVSDPLLQSVRIQTNRETEAAVFGDANYRLTSSLKATVGLRISRTEFDFDQVNYGPTLGYNIPTTTNGGITRGSIREHPITPRFGVSYQIDPHDMIYATAAEGFRMGGVNSPPAVSRCAGDLAALGITSTPRTFKSDSVWSYEAGAKLRLLGGRAQLNGSLFRIDWKNPQTQFGLPTCGFAYTINAGDARSQGFDLDARARLWDPWNVSVQVAYTDVRFIENVTGPAPTNTRFISVGDLLPTAPWNVNLGVQYNAPTGGPISGYVRIDYRFTSRFVSGRRFPSSSYNPDTEVTEASHLVNLRAGTSWRGFEASWFVNNLLGSQDLLTKAGGRTGCVTAECQTYRSNTPVLTVSSFRPRTLGMSLLRRF